MKADALLWLRLLQGFASVFSSPSFGLFTSACAAWALCTGRHTVTRIYLMGEPERKRAHDAYHRFFRCAAWCLDELWRDLTVLIVEAVYPEGVVPLMLDDTTFHKTGRKIVGAAWWRDAVRSTATKTVHCFGLNLVVLSLKILPPWGGEPLALPLNLRVHLKGKATLLELAQEMLCQLAEWLPLRRFILTADGFYAPLAGAALPRTTLISRIRHDAALYQIPPAPRKRKRGRPRRRGKRLPTPSRFLPSPCQWKKLTLNIRGKQIHRLLFCRQVLWYHVCPTHPILLIICRDPAGKENDDFFFTTDLTMQPAQVVEHYGSRWAIEDTFKNVKQYLGAEDPQLYAQQGPQRAAAFSFWLYSLVWFWYLKRKSSTPTWISLPWYSAKITPSFVDALAALRRMLWCTRIFPSSEKPALTARIAHVLIDALAYSA
jgi:hypothetical protein